MAAARALVLRRASARPPACSRSWCSSAARSAWVLVTAAAVGAGRGRDADGRAGAHPGVGARARSRSSTPTAARAVRGPESDPAGYHLIRGWVPAGVRAAVVDPDDPTPYWFVATRRPAELAAAIEAARTPARLTAGCSDHGRVGGEWPNESRREPSAAARRRSMRTCSPSLRVSRWLTMLPATAPDSSGPRVDRFCARPGGPAGGAGRRLATGPRESERVGVERVDAAAVGPGDEVGGRRAARATRRAAAP